MSTPETRPTPVARRRRGGPSAARSVMCVVGLAAAAAGTVMAGGALPASAAPPDRIAWWSRVNSSTATAPSPPDVAAGGLYVAGVAAGAASADPTTGAFAIAAVEFHVAPGQTASRIVLPVAGAQPADASVLACPVNGSFEAEENGPWSDVPTFDCSTHASGSLSADGAKMVIDAVAPLDRDGRLVVVLLPVGAMRLALAPPGPDSLVTVDSGAAPDTGGPTGSPPAPPVRVPAAGSVTSGTSPVLPSSALGAGAFPAASAGAEPATQTPPAERARAAGAGAGVTVTGRPLSRAAGEAATSAWARLLGTLGAVACVVAVMLSYRRRAVPERGVGRFVGARTGAPPPV